MHIVYVVRDLNKASGGPSRSVSAQATAVANDASIARVSVVFRATDDSVPLPCAERLHFLPRTQASIAQQLKELHGHFPIDVVHTQGIWTFELHQAIVFARRHRIPYVISSKGMLSDWSLSYKPWRKRIAMLLYQRKDLKLADMLVATSAEERCDVSRYVNSAKVQLLPNGCDRPAWMDESQPGNDLLSLRSASPFQMVSIGRLHPVKQFDRLIQAWAGLRPKDWILRIAGPSEMGYGETLQALIDKLKVQDCIQLVGSLDDESKWEFLRKASLFALTSASENFGMSIAEALASAVPVICTQGTPWQIIERENCGWWIDSSVESIRDTIDHAIQLTADDRLQMGLRGARLIQRDYSWAAIGAKTAEQYSNIVHR